METLLAIPIGLVIGAITSWITVRLSLGRYRQEKWWELRVRAYERVIEALCDAKAYSSEKIDAEVQGTKPPDEINKILLKRAIEARWELERAADLGGFLLDRRALDRLKRYLIEKEDAIQTGTYISVLEGTLEASDSCLTDIIEIAREDLKVDRGT